MAAVGYDETVDRAWDQFAAVLRDYLRQMRVGDTLVLDSHYDGRDDLAERPARVRLSARPGDIFRGEVPPNRLLHPLRSLSPGDHEKLLEMGFAPPDQCAHEEPARGHLGSDGYHLDVGPSGLDHLVLSTLVVFRQLWALPHPAFLRASAAGRPDVPELEAFTPEIDEDAPESSLQILVESAVEDLAGGTSVVDDEGVITLAYQDSDIHLRVLGEERYIDVYAGILDVASRDYEEEYDLTREVLQAIPTLNRQWPAVKWQLEENVLLGVIRVDGAPFILSHLTRALDAMGALLASAGDILTELSSDAEAAGHPGGAALLGYPRPAGARSLARFDSGRKGSGLQEPDPAATDDQEPVRDAAAADTIVAVLRLNTGATRDLSDDEVAELCEGDVDLVMDCLQIAKDQLSLWDTQRPDVPAEEAAAERDGWGLVIDKLLGAIAVLSQSGPA